MKIRKLLSRIDHRYAVFLYDHPTCVRIGWNRAGNIETLDTYTSIDRSWSIRIPQ